MPNIVVRFFGPSRDIAGAESVAMEIGDGETLGAVAGRLAERYPRLGEAVGVRLAVNRAYVALDQPLADGDEVAVIPPVSGGAPLPRVALVREPIDLGPILLEMRRPDAGAAATFLGTVRAEAGPAGPLAALEYYAYESMAVEQLTVIRQRAIEQFGVKDAAVIHRLGRLEIGEASIGVAVVAGHRAEAFDACRWMVDAVKTDAPIWKKDVWSDGTEQWVDPMRSEQ